MFLLLCYLHAPIQTARPVVSTEQKTMQSTALPYTALPDPAPAMPYTAMLSTALPYSAMPSVMQQGLTQWVIMVRAISSLLCLIPIGCLKESSCYNISSFRNCSSLKLGEVAKPSLSLSPPLVHRGHQSRLRMMLMSASFRRPRPGDQATVKAPKRARSTSTSRRSISPSRDYPRGTSTATRPSQASPKRAEDRPAPAQDLEAFKAEMTVNTVRHAPFLP